MLLKQHLDVCRSLLQQLIDEDILIIFTSIALCDCYGKHARRHLVVSGRGHTITKDLVGRLSSCFSHILDNLHELDAEPRTLFMLRMPTVRWLYVQGLCKYYRVTHFRTVSGFPLSLYFIVARRLVRTLPPPLRNTVVLCSAAISSPVHI